MIKKLVLKREVDAYRAHHFIYVKKVLELYHSASAREIHRDKDVVWASLVMYGDPTLKLL
jgi:hypothetical protein